MPFSKAFNSDTFGQSSNKEINIWDHYSGIRNFENVRYPYISINIDNELSYFELSNIELSNVVFSNVELNNVELINIELCNVKLSNIELSNLSLLTEH